MTTNTSNRMNQNLLERVGQDTSHRSWKNGSGFCCFKSDSEEVIKNMKTESNSYKRSCNRSVCDCKWEGKPPNSNFPKAQENGESSWDGAPKDSVVQVSKQILKGSVMWNGGVSLNYLYLIFDQSIGAPQGSQDPYTQPIPCYRDTTEQSSESQRGLTNLFRVTH